MAKNDSEPNPLDLSQFQDRDAALRLAAAGCPQSYTATARKHMTASPDMTLGWMFFASIISRMRGLHEGVVREIAASNPHAVLPLTRAWLEAIAIAFYVRRDPNYVIALMGRPDQGGPARKSFEAIFHKVKEDAAHLKPVYRELSDYSHFGPNGIWNAHSIENDEQRTVSWTDAPRWKSERDFQVACARAHELGQASFEALDGLGYVLIQGVQPRSS